MRREFSLSLLALCLSISAFPEEVLDSALIAKIREEGIKHSQAMATLHQLTDVAGARLTGSLEYKAAADWAVQRMTSWGLANAALEPWEFGHPGWSNERCAVHALTPFSAPLHVEVAAWTPSLPERSSGSVVRLNLPEEPLPEELDAAFQALDGKLKGKVLFVGPPKTPPPLLPRYAPRRNEAELQKLFDPAQPPLQRSPTEVDLGAPKRPGALREREVYRRIDAFCAAQKALARVNDAGLRNGLIRAFGNRTFDSTKAAPTVVMRNEDFGRIWRLMNDGKEAVLELDIHNTIHATSTKGYNVVAELPGREKPDEVIILAAHLDSWHAGTGATDNGTGCAVMMEALRILKAVGASPRRTVRAVLFDGEEHGTRGSQAYVKAHFGSDTNPQPGFSKLITSFHMDNGAGLLRGFRAFSPPAGVQVLRELILPFRDLGAVGANDGLARPRAPEGMDIFAFSHAGLPAIHIVQDWLEYFEGSWHTSVDTMERVLPEDLASSATILASVAFHLANRTESLPCFQKDDLPPIPKLPMAPAETKASSVK